MREGLILAAVAAGLLGACSSGLDGAPGDGGVGPGLDAASDGGSGTGLDGASEAGMTLGDASDNAPADSAAPADSGLTAAERAWLDPLNEARAAVGEAPLIWDPIAAQVALSYAQKCSFAHNPDASAQYVALGGSGGLGENIAAGAPTESPAHAVQSWLSEASSYDHSTNSCATGQRCGHYTQIVWSTTTKVGCAHVTCTTNSPFGSGGTWDMNVCDFSPPGNIVGQAPY